MAHNKLKILVIRFSSIGDIVLTTPVVRCLKNLEAKEVELHFVTKKSFASFLNTNPYIDKVHVLEGKLSALMPALKAEKFDHIIDLHNNLRSSLVKLSLGRPSRSFDKLNLRKWLITRWKINRLPNIHIVDRYMAAAAHLGIKKDGKGLDYFFPSDIQFHQGIPEGFRHDFVAFGIGGMHATKRLPNEKIIGICKKLDRKVVLLGGPADVLNGNYIAAEFGDKVFNACGLLSLDESAFMLQQAAVVISHDTGLMHIAAALNKPIISVWGNTIPEFGMTPYMPQNPGQSHIIEVKGLPCRPCSKIGYEKCPLEHFNCMEQIEENQVAAIVGKYF